MRVAILKLRATAAIQPPRHLLARFHFLTALLRNTVASRDPSWHVADYVINSLQILQSFACRFGKLVARIAMSFPGDG